MASVSSAWMMFWSWFLAHEQELSDVYFLGQLEYENPPEVIEQFEEQLSKVHPMIEMGFRERPKDGIKEIVFSANGRMELVPIVLGLVNYSPVIDGWKFTAFRQRVSDVEYILINNTRLSLSDVSFSIEMSDNHTVKLDLFVKAPLTDQVAQGVYMLLQATIGERDLMMKVEKVNLIETHPKKQRMPGQKLGSLPVILDAI